MTCNEVSEKLLNLFFKWRGTGEKNIKERTEEMFFNKIENLIEMERPSDV